MNLPELTIIDSGKKSAEENMEYDKQLLLSLNPSCSTPILHFYDWQEPSATYGYFNSPLTLLNPAAIDKHQLHLARRPTGGGIIFHQYDFAFSFLLPSSHPSFSLNTLVNYHLVNTMIANTLQPFLKSLLNPLELQSQQECTKRCSNNRLIDKQLRNFCMALPTVYDVICGDLKLAGGAQRRTKQGFLHQASIALTLPPENFLNEILDNAAISLAMKKHTFHLLEIGATPEDQKSIKKSLKNKLAENFSKFLRDPKGLGNNNLHDPYMSIDCKPTIC